MSRYVRVQLASGHPINSLADQPMIITLYGNAHFTTVKSTPLPSPPASCVQAKTAHISIWQADSAGQAVVAGAGDAVAAALALSSA